jgi:hypothetical protein
MYRDVTSRKMLFPSPVPVSGPYFPENSKVVLHRMKKALGRRHHDEDTNDEDTMSFFISDEESLSYHSSI